MKRLYQLVTLCAFILACGAGASAVTAAEPGAVAKAALERDAVCTACHNESWRTPVLTIYQTKHGVKADERTPGCQTCHGESAGHLKEGPGTKPDTVFGKGKSPVEAQNSACLSCHESKVLAKKNWAGSQHESRGVACTNCHEAHTPNQRVLNKLTQPEVCFNCHKTERAQVQRISTHPILAGKVSCSDCHDPHGSTGPKLLAKNSVNQTCFTCHTEKRGPFLWEHAPVTDDCTTCHSPHGSTNSNMLKVRPPFLCQQCHGGHGSTLRSGPTVGVPGVANTTNLALNAFGNGRMCLNCHSNIHGSNHPAGNFFVR